MCTIDLGVWGPVGSACMEHCIEVAILIVHHIWRLLSFMIVFCTVLLSRFHLEVAVVAAQMIRCLCGGRGRWWMVARTMHGAVLQAFYLEASGLSVMRSSVARRDPQVEGGEGAPGGARGS